MKVVYLDQNHWIEIARAAPGRGAAPGVSEVFANLKRSAIDGQACFPLSLGHWMETFKQSAVDRRARLAAYSREHASLPVWSPFGGSKPALIVPKPPPSERRGTLTDFDCAAKLL